MQIPRFFIDSEWLDEKGSAALIDDPKLVHQILRVLRLAVGAPIILLNGKGDLFHCRIKNQDRDAIGLSIEGKETQAIDGMGGLTVALPLIKPSRFEWALEKLTELGVTRIVPIITQRTVQKSDGSKEDGKKTDGQATHVKKERWLSIVKEAAEQSERYAIPEVVAPQKFNDFLSDLTGTNDINDFENGGTPLRYILAERNQCPHLSILLAKEKADGNLAKNITLCLGPEGGFTESELSSAAEAGLTFASLGKLILRAETAAVAGAAIVGAIRDLKAIE